MLPANKTSLGECASWCRPRRLKKPGRSNSSPPSRKRCRTTHCCLPGGKIAFYTGILDKLKLSDDETAMIMGHEMAHALREHARERLAKSSATNLGMRLGAELLGLGNLGAVAADMGSQLLTLKFSREDESEADLVGLELAARGAFQPNASVSLWQKMAKAGGGSGPAFFSTHPSGPNRIKQLQANVPKVQGLYEKAGRG